MLEEEKDYFTEKERIYLEKVYELEKEFSSGEKEELKDKFRKLQSSEPVDIIAFQTILSMKERLAELLNELSPEYEEVQIGNKFNLKIEKDLKSFYLVSGGFFLAMLLLLGWALSELVMR